MISKLELNGRQVHAFNIEVSNLGFSKLTDKIISMYRSNVWREFKDALGVFKFLPCEFDYFLSQCDVKREDLIHGIRDINVKAELDGGMDERKTGTDERRTIEKARYENPIVPGRPIMPFGFTPSEAKYLKFKTASTGRGSVRALGQHVRYFRDHGKTRASLPLLQRLIQSAAKLTDRDLDKLIESLQREQARRGSITKLKLVK